MTPLHLAAGMDRVNVCKMLVSMMMVTITIEVHQKIVNAQGAGVELHTRVANARGKMLSTKTGKDGKRPTRVRKLWAKVNG